MVTLTSSSSPGDAPPAASRAHWWLFLAGATLVPFSYHQDAVPLAAWLSPILLLGFSRAAARSSTAWLGLLAAYGIGDLIGLRGGYVPLPFPVVAALSVLGGVVHALPYILDRWLAGRVAAGWQNLALPLGMTAAEALAFRFSPFGTWGSAAYAHHGELALLQLLAVTGIWGVVFLQFWLAPLALAALSPSDAPGRQRWLVLAGLAVFVLVLGGGSLRLALSSAPTNTLRVAAVAASPDAYAQAFSNLQAKSLARAATDERAAARLRLAPLSEELFAATRATATAGAELVAWPESVPTLAEDEPALRLRAATLARELAIELLITPWVIRQTDRFPYVENLSQLFDDTGAARWRYPKAHPVLGIEDRRFGPGAGVVPVAETSRGQLAAVICHDADFPWLVRQAGAAGADVLVVPADDWPAIRHVHAEMAIFRAIENGVSLVRPTSNGISVIADPYGRVLGRVSTDGARANQLLTAVPRRGVRTLYAAAGDWFAALAVAATVALVTAGRRERRVTARQATTAP